MKKYLLSYTHNGRTLYATTDYLCTVTEHKERAKRFTLKKANKLINTENGKIYQIEEE